MLSRIPQLRITEQKSGSYLHKNHLRKSAVSHDITEENLIKYYYDAGLEL